MNRTIKFRGRDAYGKYRYGFYVECSGVSYITENHDGDEVDPDTVAQLVGYDANGKEVYEGDTLIDDDGEEFIAQLQGVVRWELDDKSKYADMPDHLKTAPFDFAQQYTPLTLKEVSTPR